jgi:chorismate dehydratase
MLCKVIHPRVSAAFWLVFCFWYLFFFVIGCGSAVTADAVDGPIHIHIHVIPPTTVPMDPPIPSTPTSEGEVPSPRAYCVDVSDRRSQSPATRSWDIGSVSFLNAKPLIQGLDRHPRVRMHLEVPSKLLAGLQERRFDVALLPVIDYQRLAGLRLIPAGGIGSDGPTLTVRIFSRTPFERIETLLCDTDSHTSVALARVILAERYGRRPTFVDLAAGASRGNDLPRLLIGDKVITDEPKDCPYQIDLGQAWKELTGLPFVFAAWMGRADADLGDLPAILDEARRRGMAEVEQIVRHYAPEHRWPTAIARQYLTQNLRFEIGDREIEAIRLFHRLAAKHGVIEHDPWP